MDDAGKMERLQEFSQRLKAKHLNLLQTTYKNKVLNSGNCVLPRTQKNLDQAGKSGGTSRALSGQRNQRNHSQLSWGGIGTQAPAEERSMRAGPNRDTMHLHII